MQKERLRDMCDRDTVEGAISMIVSNRIDIGGIVGLKTDSAIKAAKEVVEYLEYRKLKEKRNPDNKGVLPLTKDELEEFHKIAGWADTLTLTSVYLRNGHVKGKVNGCESVVKRYAAFEWLLERFNIVGK